MGIGGTALTTATVAYLLQSAALGVVGLVLAGVAYGLVIAQRSQGDRSIQKASDRKLPEITTDLTPNGPRAQGAAGTRHPQQELL